MTLPLFTAAPRALRHFNIFQSFPRTWFSTLTLGQSKIKKPHTVFTFTTSERFARVWHFFARRALPANQWHIVIGDSSGSIRPELFAGAEIFKIYNFTHGKKIDLFLDNVISSPITLLCDDDVYLARDIVPALAELEDDRVKAVSLRPRTWYHLEYGDKRYEPMGSYAILMKRFGVSFMPRKEICAAKVFPPGTKAQPYYDTADYANEQLLKAGYRIPTHPADEFTLGFDGMTTPTILLQRYGVAYVRKALQEAKHFKAGSLNGAQVRGLYCYAAFEELYHKLFGDRPPYEYPSREELRALPHPELYGYFDGIDDTLAKLLQKI